MIKYIRDAVDAFQRNILRLCMDSYVSWLIVLKETGNLIEHFDSCHNFTQIIQVYPRELISK